MEYPIRVAICGLGSRGKDTYAPVSELIPEQFQVVAIAEPDEGKRNYCAQRYHIAPDMCFATGEEMFKAPRLADAALICTQDQQHVGHAVAALRQGYHLLLEKPIATTLDDLRLIEKTAREMERRVVVCHVLRYAPFFEEIRAAIERGDVGEVVNIQALENVAYWHHAHSYVRGNWRNESMSTFMLLAKCCHDLDYLVWLCGGRKCERVSSFGSLKHFRPECAPEGAAPRCTAGCKAKDSCPYDAEKIYLTHERTGILAGNTEWPANILALHPSEETIREAIEHGPYGRCVYACDNDVVDNQIVNMQMEGGVCYQLMMTAFTSHGGRTIRVMGTHGAIEGDMEENILRIQTYGKPERVINIDELGPDIKGHGGGDARLVDEFVRYLHDGKAEGGRLSTIEASAESHYIAFAAEMSRRQGGAVVEVADLRL